MAGYIGTKAVALSTTTGNILGDMTVGGTTDVATLEFNSLSGTGAVTITDILDEDNLASNSATKLATQQSIKAYVDAQVDTVDTLAEILAVGNRTSGAGKIEFRDAAIYLNSSADGQLDIVADTEIQIAATTVDLNGNLDVSGTALVTGVLTTTAATVFNGGFAANDSCTITKAGDPNVVIRNTAGGSGDPVSLTLRRRAEDDAYTDWTFNNSSGKLSIIGDDATIANNPAMTINFNGDVVFNEGALNADFRVETVNRPHAIFVDASTDKIGIGVSDPDAILDISRGTNALGALRVTQRASGAAAYGLDVGLDASTGDPVFSRILNDAVTEAFRIKRSSGLLTAANGLTLTDGNLTVAAGHGINFSAQTPASGITPSAEILDHYEEGSGSFSSVTNSAGAALSVIGNLFKYTRIGRFVQLEIRVRIAGATTAEVRLNGPPFTIASSDSILGLTLGDRTVFAFSSSQIRLLAGDNNAYMYGVVTYTTT